jgi:hypothetical protein
MCARVVRDPEDIDDLADTLTDKVKALEASRVHKIDTVSCFYDRRR